MAKSQIFWCLDIISASVSVFGNIWSTLSTSWKYLFSYLFKNIGFNQKPLLTLYWNNLCNLVWMHIIFNICYNYIYMTFKSVIKELVFLWLYDVKGKWFMIYIMEIIFMFKLPFWWCYWCRCYRLLSLPVNADACLH